MNVTILRFFTLIADVLLRLRYERGESQVAVAARAGLANPQISKYERGVVTPDLSTTLQLLHAYGQHLVVMPAPLAETLPERDVVVAAASRWYAIGPSSNPHELIAAVEKLVAAELRHGGGAHARLVEGGDR